MVMSRGSHWGARAVVATLVYYLEAIFFLAPIKFLSDLPQRSTNSPIEQKK